MKAIQQQGMFGFSFQAEGDHKPHYLGWIRYPKTKPCTWWVTRSSGACWDFLHQIEEIEYQILLVKFRILYLKRKLPLEIIRHTGPNALICLRREIERQHGLVRHNVQSETIGYDAWADRHVD